MVECKDDDAGGDGADDGVFPERVASAKERYV